MIPEETEGAPPTVKAFAGADVATILREERWLTAEPSAEQHAWCERVAALLGTHVEDRRSLVDLIKLIFRYDAGEMMRDVETHIVLSRYGARDVVRKLGVLLLKGGPLTSERFKEIVSVLKESLDLRGRELFHPIRLALAGRAGEGELDRVILLLDDAAILSFDAQVKTTRERILEFCAALD